MNNSDLSGRHRVVLQARTAVGCRKRRGRILGLVLGKEQDEHFFLTSEPLAG